MDKDNHSRLKSDRIHLHIRISGRMRVDLPRSICSNQKAHCLSDLGDNRSACSQIRTKGRRWKVKIDRDTCNESWGNVVASSGCK